MILYRVNNKISKISSEESSESKSSSFFSWLVIANSNSLLPSLHYNGLVKFLLFLYSYKGNLEKDRLNAFSDTKTRNSYKSDSHFLSDNIYIDLGIVLSKIVINNIDIEHFFHEIKIPLSLYKGMHMDRDTIDPALLAQDISVLISEFKKAPINLGEDFDLYEESRVLSPGLLQKTKERRPYLLQLHTYLYKAFSNQILTEVQNDPTMKRVVDRIKSNKLMDYQLILLDFPYIPDEKMAKADKNAKKMVNSLIGSNKTYALIMENRMDEIFFNISRKMVQDIGYSDMLSDMYKSENPREYQDYFSLNKGKSNNTSKPDTAQLDTEQSDTTFDQYDYSDFLKDDKSSDAWNRSIETPKKNYDVKETFLVHGSVAYIYYVSLFLYLFFVGIQEPVLDQRKHEGVI